MKRNQSVRMGAIAMAKKRENIFFHQIVIGIIIRNKRKKTDELHTSGCLKTTV